MSTTMIQTTMITNHKTICRHLMRDSTLETKAAFTSHQKRVKRDPARTAGKICKTNPILTIQFIH